MADLKNYLVASYLQIRYAVPWSTDLLLEPFGKLIQLNRCIDTSITSLGSFCFFLRAELLADQTQLRYLAWWKEPREEASSSKYFSLPTYPVICLSLHLVILSLYCPSI